MINGLISLQMFFVQEKRLVRRGTEDLDSLSKRLELAKQELAYGNILSLVCPIPVDVLQQLIIIFCYKKAFT